MGIVSFLSLDVETYSATDLTKSGVYRYSEDPDFEIMLLAYSLDGAPVEVVDLTDVCGDGLPDNILHALTDPTVLKVAYNASFERTVLAKHFNLPMPPEQWECTLVKAAMLGLPMNLEAVAKVLKLTSQKDAAGKALIKYFSGPCKPTKANGMRTRNLPHHAPEKWAAFIEYCRQDVVVEQAIRQKISFFEMPASEKKLWCLDQRINDRGILIDPVLIHNAIRIDEESKERLAQEAMELTGLANPKSGAQLKAWLLEETGEEVKSLTKDTIPDLIKNCKSEEVERMLHIRQELGNTSTSKYTAMLRCQCADGRVRGLLRFYGANQSGRHSSILIQMQNLKRSSLKDLDLARQVVRRGEGDALEMLFGTPSDVLSQLIRTAFVAPEGHRLLVSDYSNIEVIVAAWVAGEQWVIDEFNSTRKIYETAASRMMHKPLEAVTKDDRQKGKVATLSCQYGGGVGAMIAMGALNYGISEDDLPEIVAQWRRANPKTTAYWKIIENAAIRAVKHGEVVKLSHGIILFMRKGVLFMRMPNGRHIAYVSPGIEEGKFGNDALFYYAIDQKTRQWCKQSTWGGTLFNNLIQGTARDCLMEGLLRLDAAGYSVVSHVHDEIICDMPEGKGTLEEMNELMAAPISLAPGLPLAAEGFESKYYKK